MTLRWNARNSNALTAEQKTRVLQNLQSQLTTEGEIIIQSSSTRSQEQNKELAFANLAQKIRKALYVPKKRMATRVSKAAKESRLQAKKKHGLVKKLRSTRPDYE